MRDGIHERIGFDAYTAIERMNWSTLKWGDISLKHLKSAFDRKMTFEDTRDKKLGRAVHSAILEPEVFAERFKIATQCEAFVKAGTRCTSLGSYLWCEMWFCGTHVKVVSEKVPEKPTDVISEGENEQLEGIKKSLSEHDAVNIIKAAGGCEVAACWTENGIECKALLDKFIAQVNGRPAIIDIKTCMSGKIEYRNCSKAIADYGYIGQAAFYSKAIRALFDQDPMFVWLFVEKSAPFDILPIECDDESMRIGHTMCDALIGNWKAACEDFAKGGREKDCFHGVSDEMISGGVPQWMRDQYADKTKGEYDDP